MLSRTTFFVKERIGFVKITDAYDIFDPETQQQIGVAKEEPAAWAKYLRLIIDKRLLPTTVNVYENGNETPLFSIHRPTTFFRSKVRVTGPGAQSFGYFKSKLFSLGGGFHVFDSGDRQVAEVKGDWKGWNFKFVTNDGREVGSVTKKWAGIGKELFTSADNYMISLADAPGGNTAASTLLLAAGLAIDVVYKEKS